MQFSSYSTTLTIGPAHVSTANSTLAAGVELNRDIPGSANAPAVKNARRVAIRNPREVWKASADDCGIAEAIPA